MCSLAQPAKVVLNLALPTCFNRNLILYLVFCSPKRFVHDVCFLKPFTVLVIVLNSKRSMLGASCRAPVYQEEMGTEELGYK